MVKDTTVRVSTETRLKIGELRFDYRVNHLGDVVEVLVELAKKNPKEAKRIAGLIKNSTDAQIVVMHYNPHLAKNLN